MRKHLLAGLAFFVLSTFTVLRAVEGMWIPMLLGELNEDEMRRLGLRLTAEDIYSINHTSLKDGIVLFGGGCTGEVVSPQGLLLTNHHCGYSYIHRHSSLEHDYLTNGFWANSYAEELPCEGLKVTFLVRMEKVTDEVLKGVHDSMTEEERRLEIRDNINALVRQATDSTHYTAEVRSFFYGNEYYLFVNEVYEDVRLVGAPPLAIGNFGGDYDNWAWPRHTGDFSVFRIYAGKDNQPARYSKDNVPFTPRYHFTISLAGVKEGDFTMVYGYPGRTQQYLTSWGVEMLSQVVNPIRIKLRTSRLETFNRFMEKDPAVRLQYAAKRGGIANSWKKWIGENRGILRTDAIRKKISSEAEFTAWLKSGTRTKRIYGGLLPAFEETYKELTPIMHSHTFISEGIFGIEILRFARNFLELINLSEAGDRDPALLSALLANLKNSAKSFYKGYHAPIDREAFMNLLTEYNNSSSYKFRPELFWSILDDYKGNLGKFTERVFTESLFASEERLLAFLDTYKPSRARKLEDDDVFGLASAFDDVYRNVLTREKERLEQRLDSLSRVYLEGILEMDPHRRYSPDANSTLRLTYGKVDSYYPQNAVRYHYFTTLGGVMQKEDTDVYEFSVPQRLKTLFEARDYGRYADSDGTLHTCFIATNHTSGGNSGSPVLDAEGRLIGINFDRNWEGTMSDIIYDPSLCRNITLDIRYCLFIIDKFAGARRLVDEMTIAE